MKVYFYKQKESGKKVLFEVKLKNFTIKKTDKSTFY